MNNIFDPLLGRIFVQTSLFSSFSSFLYSFSAFLVKKRNSIRGFVRPWACPSVRPSVGPLVPWSLGPSVRRSVGPSVCRSVGPFVMRFFQNDEFK